MRLLRLILSFGFLTALAVPAQQRRYPGRCQPGARHHHRQRRRGPAGGGRFRKKTSPFWITTCLSRSRCSSATPSSRSRCALLIDISGSTAKDLKYEVDSIAKLSSCAVRRRESQRRRGALRVQLSGCEIQSLHAQRFFDRAFSADSSRRSRHFPLRRHLSRVARAGVPRGTARHGDRHRWRRYHQHGRTFMRRSKPRNWPTAVIYPILVVPIPTEVGRNVGGENALTTLSAGTGGHVFRADPRRRDGQRLHPSD